MARVGSIEVGGYFPTPEHLISRIANLFEKPIEPSEEVPSYSRNRAVYVLDPCAGEGVAVHGLAKLIAGEKHELYTCEMEASRYDRLKERIGWQAGAKALHGDAFQATYKIGSHGGVSILFLNPPYDLDRTYGRLEQRFLDRFTGTLARNGILVFLVPYYALSASAETLAKEYTDLSCFRFPGSDFDTFKQVVLFAKKTDALLTPDPTILVQVQAWAKDPTILAELPEIGAQPLYSTLFQTSYEGGLQEWRMRKLDITRLLSKVKPWQQSTRGGETIPVPGIIPETPVQELLLRHYPLATPPRPAHIAAGIASGLFNGARLEPSDKSKKLPPILVKGVFDREYRTVEEKTNKDGEVKGVVQVQQPKLVTTILDLRQHKYHVLGPSTEKSKKVDVSTMTIADLIEHYGDSMMNVMLEQCPIFYDPRRDAASIPIADSPRKPYTAQAHAIRALVKLLGGPKASKAQRKGKAAILLGEIGAGKSLTAMMVGETIGSKRTLILCPPHLLDGWTEQIAASLPHATPKVLRTVEDIDDLRSIPPDQNVIAILSRETAKLTHSWEGVRTGKCSKCGALTPSVDLAKKRSQCEHQELIAADPIAQWALKVAIHLSASMPTDATVNTILRRHIDQVRLAKLASKETKPAAKIPDTHLDEVIRLLVQAHTENAGEQSKIQRTIFLALLLRNNEDMVLETCKSLVEANKHTTIDRDLLFLLPETSEKAASYIEERKKEHGSYYNPFSEIETTRTRIKKGENWVTICGTKPAYVDDRFTFDEMTPTSEKLLPDVFRAIASLGSFKWTKECGEFLYNAIPEPRRVGLAKHITRYHSDLFDFLIVDECHEYGTDANSAQSLAAHRLTSMGLPTILMTGSILNGYAESVFINMWAVSSDFRREFERDESQKFVDRFGYRKRLLEDRDKQSGEIVAFGSNSDRVQRSERVIGNAPGILPLFILRHLLPVSVTLHKADLAIDLPKCHLEKHIVKPSAEQSKRFRLLQERLVRQIKQDRFQEGLAGKLWGQLAELPSYLDRAATGNAEKCYEIAYPESVGGQTVVSVDLLPHTALLPKEAWMLDTIEKELSEGRNVMVFGWHVDLLPRLASLISARIADTVPILYADKVPTAKRQAWIEKEIVKKGRRVMVTNPVAIQTGLNNLVHFASEIWMENPACNPITYRQAIGRVDRIGQKKETRIHFPIYEGTLQEQLYDLLMRKVAVSVGTDGIDNESALAAAGIGEEGFLGGLSIGRELWKLFAAEEAA